MPTETTAAQAVTPESTLKDYVEFYNAETRKCLKDEETSMNMIADKEAHCGILYRLRDYNSFEPYVWPKLAANEKFWAITPLRLAYDDKTIDTVKTNFVGWSWELFVCSVHTLARKCPYIAPLKAMYPQYKWVPWPDIEIEQKLEGTGEDSTLTGTAWALVVEDLAFIGELTRPEGVLKPYECDDFRIIRAYAHMPNVSGEGLRRLCC